jgi:hypothetical protein
MASQSLDRATHAASEFHEREYGRRGHAWRKGAVFTRFGDVRE